MSQRTTSEADISDALFVELDGIYAEVVDDVIVPLHSDSTSTNLSFPLFLLTFIHISDLSFLLVFPSMSGFEPLDSPSSSPSSPLLSPLLFHLSGRTHGW